MGRLVLAFLVLSVLSLSLNLLNPVGPSIIPVVGILDGRFDGNVNVIFWKSVDEVLARLKRGDVDLAVLPVSMGANLYNKGLKIRLAAVTMWKAFYIVGYERIESLSELRGKRLLMPHTRGTTVDVILRYMLEEAGIDPDRDLRLVYAPPQEIVGLLKARKAEIAALPEPFVTLASKIPGVKVSLDFQEEWAKFTGLPPRIPITGVFVVGNPSGVREALGVLRDSLSWALSNPDEACADAVKYLKGFKKDVLLEAMGRSDYEFHSTDEGIVRWMVMEYLKVISGTYPKAMPKVPDEGFFWGE